MHLLLLAPLGALPSCGQCLVQLGWGQRNGLRAVRGALSRRLAREERHRDIDAAIARPRALTRPWCASVGISLVGFVASSLPLPLQPRKISRLSFSLVAAVGRLYLVGHSPSEETKETLACDTLA